MPAAVVFLDALPLTRNGKVDVAALPAAGREVPRQRAEADPDRPTPEQPASAPVEPGPANWDAARIGLERLVVDVWRDVLGVAQVGTRDNFFDLGGHSMRLLAVLKRLHERLGDVVTVTDLFRNPTVESLAAFLTTATTGAQAPVAPATTARVTRPRTGTTAQPGGLIAVVGMACRFPGARTIDEYWHNIRAGVESVRQFSVEEMLADGADPSRLRRSRVRPLRRLAARDRRVRRRLLRRHAPGGADPRPAAPDAAGVRLARAGARRLRPGGVTPAGSACSPGRVAARTCWTT